MTRVETRYFFILFTFIAVFNYLYPIAINGIPLDTGEMLHIVGIFYFLLYKKFLIPQSFLKLFSYTMIMLAIGMITSIINNIFEFSLLKKIISIYLYSFSAILILDLMAKSTKNLTFSTILEYIVSASVIQAIISLFFFFNKEYQDALINFMSPDVTRGDFMSTQASFRLIALAKTQYANMAIMYGISFLAMIFLAFSKNSSLYKYKILYYVCLLIILIAGILSARTFFIILIVSITYLFYVLYKKRKRKLIFYFIISGIIGLILFLMGITSLLDSEYGKTFAWAFEWYVNMKDTGTANTGSTEVLRSMYFLPTEMKTWIIGDAIFTTEDGSFYKRTDVGYLRNLFYWGIIGSIVFYYIQYKYCKLVFNNASTKTVVWFCIAILMCFYVYNTKEFWHANLYWALFLAGVIKLKQ